MCSVKHSNADDDYDNKNNDDNDNDSDNDSDDDYNKLFHQYWLIFFDNSFYDSRLSVGWNYSSIHKLQWSTVKFGNG